MNAITSDASWLSQPGWTPQQWQWSPSEGRWSLSHGLPRAPIYFEASTDGVPSASRYDFWRSLFYYSFDAERVSPAAARRFEARVRCLIGDPAQLYLYKSEPVAGRGVPAADADDRETYVIGLVIAGSRKHEQEGCAPAVSHPGQFFVFDNRWASRVEWTRHVALHLSLARSELEQILGGSIPEPREMLEALEGSRMASTLKAQLRLVTSQLGKKSDIERAFLLAQLVQLANFTCERALAESDDQSAFSRRDTFGLALAVIEQNLTRPGFSAANLLAHLGCSRATLYRAFSQNGTSVADAISAMRVERAKSLMANSPEMPLSTVATRSGWYDNSSFSRVFRAREGVTPSQYRQRLRNR